ncbi:B3 domain-containing protein At2g33720-like [Vicia villosa]|uniref:B3 domain-containing protein At2g33720-like n=1 Tax=Vicia villosa TaxID=3911 RepID=UPI00273CF45A|nr:B3 domain-containing protein At2g33720-like [Vicia villosa]
MALFKIHDSPSSPSSYLSSSITTNADGLGSLSCKRKCRQQETSNISSLLDLSSYPNETNVCLHLSLSFCNCIQIAKKQKLAHQETNANAVGTSSDSSTNGDDPWKIRKVLTASDLGNNSRLLLKKELAKKWVVPFLDKDPAEKDGVKVSVFDVDTQDLRSLVFKVWPSNGSHVFNDTWITDFVDKRNLKAGDEIGLKWDKEEKKFDFSVLRRGSSQQI